MDVMALKQYIFENDKIGFVLNKIGCHDIKYHEGKEYYSAAFPDGDNLQGINIRSNNYLNYRSFTRNVSYSDKKDLISLVEYTKNVTFVESLKWLHNILQLPFTVKHQNIETPKIININQVFIDAKTSYRKTDVFSIKQINPEIMNDYIPILHISWLKEGIMPWTREKIWFSLFVSAK